VTKGHNSYWYNTEGISGIMRKTLIQV